MNSDKKLTACYDLARKTFQENCLAAKWYEERRPLRKEFFDLKTWPSTYNNHLYHRLIYNKKMSIVEFFDLQAMLAEGLYMHLNAAADYYSIEQIEAIYNCSFVETRLTARNELLLACEAKESLNGLLHEIKICSSNEDDEQESLLNIRDDGELDALLSLRRLSKDLTSAHAIIPSAYSRITIKSYPVY